MMQVFLFGIFLLACGVGTKCQGINDPIANIQLQPISGAHPNANNDYSSEILEKRQNLKDSRLTSNSSPPDKRNAEDNLLVVSSLFQNEPNIQGRFEDSGGSSEEQCRYTFVVPKQSQQCAGSFSQQAENNEMKELQEEVREIKSQIDALNRSRHEDDSSVKLGTLHENVDILQQESRNMDSRVSQIYMQLMHEIINKRDNSLELRNLQNKLLNHTVDYYKLKENYQGLKQEHNELRAKVNIQSQELNLLRHHVQKLVLQKSVAAVETKPASTPEPIETHFDQPESSLPAPTTNFPAGPFKDCAQVQRAGYTASGIFNLKLSGYDKKIRVWCDFDQDPGGWMVIQRRTGRRVNFYRNMAAYIKGFGRAHSDYWLGLEHLHRLTNQSGVNFKLHIDMEDWSGRKTFVEYQSFRVEGKDGGYKLKINHYSGTAGDSLTWHNNMRFTTMDSDNDQFAKNCARIHRGGWWYNSCAQSNLNGVYYRGGNYRNYHQDGVYWSEWRGASYSLKSVAMKIRPTDVLI